MDKKHLSDMGEMGLLALIEKQIKGSLAAIPSSKSMGLVLGVGDDCAVIQCNPSHYLLVSTDLFVENIHFKRHFFSPDQLGYKVLAANVSDIAAMGGLPTQVLVGLAMPSNTPIDFVQGLYQGLIRTGEEFGIQIIGGDTVGSEGPVLISITILGIVEHEHLLTRRGASPGDRILVTGELGTAMLGLEILENQHAARKTIHADPQRQKMTQGFIHPIPRVTEARILAKNHLATSMIDLSDSLSQDLTYLCRASNVGARLRKDDIPIATETRKILLAQGKDPIFFTLAGGEDYELLFTVRPEDVQRTKDLFAGEKCEPVHEIGEICPAFEGIRIQDESGHSDPVDPSGFEHFSVSTTP